MRMNAIVVVDQNWAIGRDNSLLFSLPTDMKRFRDLTLGGTVLMGHRTLNSFPGGKPLRGRRNIVVTKGNLEAENVEVVHTPDDLRAIGVGPDSERVFVIGGGSVYAAMLPHCRKAFVTKVDTKAEDPDTFFPNLDKLPNWTVVGESEPMEENGLAFRFVEYQNTEL